MSVRKLAIILKMKYVGEKIRDSQKAIIQFANWCYRMLNCILMQKSHVWWFSRGKFRNYPLRFNQTYDIHLALEIWWWLSRSRCMILQLLCALHQVTAISHLNLILMWIWLRSYWLLFCFLFFLCYFLMITIHGHFQAVEEK